MGKCETSSISVGINILVKDLIDAINETNYDEIEQHFLNYNSMIEDENGYYNSVFLQIIEGCDLETKEYIDMDELNYSEYKNFLTKNFKLYGENLLKKYDEDDENNLYNQSLLVPFDNILDTDRWGYDREGTNASSCTLDSINFDKITSDIHNKMKELTINKYSIALIVKQSSD